MITVMINNIELSVPSVGVDSSSLDLRFHSSDESMQVFNRLKDCGIQCYHAGSNAPHGPYVAIYRKENKNLNIKMT